jgi:hypothetical protein
MPLALLLVTLLLSLAVSILVVRAFAAPLDIVLKRIIAAEISWAWLKYLKFATLVVGVSAGVRVREFEKYLTPLRSEREAKISDFTFERWVLEFYRTAIETLQGIAWMLLVFFVFALIAYVIIRIAELKFGHAKDWPKS